MSTSKYCCLKLLASICLVFHKSVCAFIFCLGKYQNETCMYIPDNNTTLRISYVKSSLQVESSNLEENTAEYFVAPKLAGMMST